MDIFSSLTEFRGFIADLPRANSFAKAEAENRNAKLTKPQGALGDLENLAIWYASWVGDGRPSLVAPQVIIFAGNHGVAAAGVSAFPSEVTQQMVYNFQAGGAAINQICNVFGAKIEVVSLDLERPTQDFTQGPAMSENDLLVALQA
ncbi:MAG: nicotinate-nucleotide--dimethylbenzimidazole phosphoribosyltransferase, partial [Planktomarina sp.]|nr:nicotinate-nucleotide--dimethylbenzimidazole phosphoribosyltransferase [Planktomarina sp.]